MKRILLILAACACACAWAGVASARLGSLGRNDTVVTNVTDVTPGNYETVSNRAMTASAYTDAALGAFAATGAVRRAEIYGTPTRWTDATGCVWEVTYITNTSASSWTYQTTPQFDVYGNGLDLFWSDGEDPYLKIGWWVINGPAYFTNDTKIVRLEYSGTYTDEGTGDTRTGHVIATRVSVTNMIGRTAMTNDIPDVSGYATQQQATNAAVAVADTKISTNNAAFVSAVLSVPLTGADAGDLAEVAEYGGYGTVGAALLALIAGLAALKRRMATTEAAVSENATAVASVRADLPYRLVVPGEWELSDGGTHFVSGPGINSAGDAYVYWLDDDTELPSQGFSTQSDALSALSLTFDNFGTTVTATRPSLPGHLCDRAGNRVVVTGDTTLTLPDAVAGYARDFLVRLEISGSTVPTITFAAPTGETIVYETDGDEFPVPDEAGTWLYSFTESCVAHKFAVALKKVNTVAQGGS